MHKIRSERIKILKRLYPFLKAHRLLYFALAYFKILGMILLLLTPILYLCFVNGVLIDKDIRLLIYIITGYVGIYCLETLNIIFNKITYNKLFIKLNLNIKKFLISKLGKMRTVDYNNYDLGDLKNRIENDTGIIEKFYTTHCLDYIYSILCAVIIAAILLYINWFLALFGLIMVPLSFLFAKIMSRKAGKTSYEYRERYGKYEGFLHSSIQNWKEIKINSLEKQKENVLESHWNILTKLYFKNQLYKHINNSFVEFKDFFITKINLYFVGGLLIINNQFDIAALLVFMSYYDRLFENITAITNSIVSFKQDQPSLMRIMEICEYNPPLKEKRNYDTDGLSIRNIYFKYPQNDKYVLNNITFDVVKNEHLAIVGRSGSGKSTLIKLILGLYEPSKGCILLGSNEIKKIELGHKIGVVMQEPTLFNLSIKDNLQMAKRTASQEELDYACNQAHIYDFIQKLPEKYETVIGEGGINLSGGQKQRLAIARAILFNPDIFIFDEATSSLDNESEKAIRNTIENLSSKKTIITISHRFTSLIEADRVLVIDEGKIIAIGTHSELRGNNAIYDLLFENQYSGEELNVN